MRRQKSFGSLLAVSLLWLVIAVTRAVTMVDRPGRWVDIVSLMAFTYISGLFLARAVEFKRAEARRVPEASSGGAPISPQ